MSCSAADAADPASATVCLRAMSTAQRYDAVIIGGGHNGLVTAAYLARAGMRVVCLERRDVLGGAAVTEEIVPGFRFSVASYVVSLLRPEIIRDLDLGRHGLQILPLDGTFTPLDDDYLWRVNDHGTTFRELRPLVAVRRRGIRGVRPADGARWRASSSRSCRSFRPTRARIHPAEWISLGPLARSVRRAAATPARHLHPGDDDERRRLPRPVVRD